MKKTILFVCYANAGRSATAEYALKGIVKDKTLDVRSAGIAAEPGKGAPDPVKEAASQIGLDITAHKRRLLTKEIADKADEIYVFEKAHKKEVESRFPATKGKVHVLKEVPDYAGTPLQTHVKYAKEIKEAVEKLAKKRGWA